mmetsp:Transcript_140656/g.448542  ORF Transcript_140656/g.448542 Transcript_140656/m.448542 type:complete len:592 (-) Transcript_140656:226-2001(-)
MAAGGGPQKGGGARPRKAAAGGEPPKTRDARGDAAAACAQRNDRGGHLKLRGGAALLAIAGCLLFVTWQGSATATLKKGDGRGAASSSVDDLLAGQQMHHQEMPLFAFDSLLAPLPWTAGGGVWRTGVVPKPGGSGAAGGGRADGDARRSFALLRGAIRPWARELRSSLEGLADGSAFGIHADEVDGLPAYESYLLLRGQPSAGLGASSGGTRVVEALEEIMPFLRGQYTCEACVACTAFLRRYRQGERLLNPNHFDMEAFVTIVVALSDSSEHGGGLYVQSNASAQSRRLLTMDTGDVLMHQYDLNHGVAVSSGMRYSLVVWVASNRRACADGHSPWYADDAARGDADAQWNLGHLHKRGERGYALNSEAAFEWYRKSALQGHPGAMNNLALMLEERSASDDVGASFGADGGNADAWFRRSAELGEANGQMNLARRLAAAGSVAEATRLYAKAASQGFPKAMVALGALLEDEAGGAAVAASAADRASGSMALPPSTPEEWYLRAATLGHGPAFRALGRLHESKGAADVASDWHRRGGEQGDGDCMIALAKQHLQGAGVDISVEAAKAWLRRAAATGPPEAEQLLTLLSEM